MIPKDVFILVVDDMSSSRMIVKSALIAAGFMNFVDADDGVTALEKLHQQRDAKKPIGLVVCDWNMPRMNGQEFLTAVRGNDHFKKLPIIMVSAEGSDEQMLQAMRNGAAYVLKPYTDEQLLETIERVWASCGT